MLYLDLAGEWLLTRDDGDSLAGHLPGCTYLDYMAKGMPDPFWDMNETEANKLAHHDYCYSRRFTVTEEMMQKSNLVLVGDGLDTLCTLTLNGKVLGKTNNINRVWRFDIKPFCTVGENEIKIDIADPYKFIEEMQSKDELPRPATPIAGVGHIRKSVYNFGWDWGPKLPPAGVTRAIAVEAYDFCIEETKIKQLHHDGKVTLELGVEVVNTENQKLTFELHITDPDGREKSYKSTDGRWRVTIDEPKLWWCSGLGEQPLYKLRFSVTDSRDSHVELKQVGLRTIELDTSKDEHGKQFRFIINGVPIFAKGANWIPADSFITRVTQEMMDWYMDAAKRANMNMLRVWGGGLFETEEFYNACDRCGILVWQDFLFCDNPYPFACVG